MGETFRCWAVSCCWACDHEGFDVDWRGSTNCAGRVGASWRVVANVGGAEESAYRSVAFTRGPSSREVSVGADCCDRFDDVTSASVCCWANGAGDSGNASSGAPLSAS